MIHYFFKGRKKVSQIPKEVKQTLKRINITRRIIIAGKK